VHRRVRARAAEGAASLVVGIAGLAACVLAYGLDPQRFAFSYLVAFAFWTTLALGGLFFTMLQHLTGAVWSVVVRRGAEALALTIPLLAVFFLPLLAGAHDLFSWMRPGAAAGDRVLAGKAPFLDPGFFVVRAALYFAVWIVLAVLLYRRSTAQDADGRPEHTAAMRRISAPGMFLFAFTVSFAAIDWLMSLDPHWYSTIFGVYIFAGGFLASLAFLTLFYQWLRARGVLAGAVTADHYHDFGRLLFAFTVFWAYIAASQYFLIWYANLPEETEWFIRRDVGSWRAVGIAIVLGHFVVPFLVLAFHAAKRSPAVLRTMAALLLVMHYVDLYWIVMPMTCPAGASTSWIDAAALLGIGGVAVWFFLRRFAAAATVPVGDPKLGDSLAYRI
jgi:hypothetical protein